MSEMRNRRAAGALEAEVLAALWESVEPLTPADLQRRLGGRLARTTVATILARLQAKGAVERRKVGRSLFYTPVHDADGLVARRMHTELGRGRDRRTVLARFVSSLSRTDERLLRSLLGEDAEGADRSW